MLTLPCHVEAASDYFHMAARANRRDAIVHISIYHITYYKTSSTGIVPYISIEIWYGTRTVS